MLTIKKLDKANYNYYNYICTLCKIMSPDSLVKFTHKCKVGSHFGIQVNLISNIPNLTFTPNAVFPLCE